jgi:hypothetical protein
MELIPKEIEATIPDLFSTESVPHPLAVIKLFDPCSRYTFFVLEARREPDGDLRLFGFCRSPLGPDGDEFGFASLRELESVRGPLGQCIERDLHFEPTPLSKIRGSGERKELMQLGQLIDRRIS